MASGKKISGLKKRGILEKWREAMNCMELKDLLKIKYCHDESEKWQIMYSPYGTDKKSFYCSVCKMVLIDGNVLKNHNGLNKHKTSLETVVHDLLHETTNPFKNDKDRKNVDEVFPDEKDFKNKINTLTLEELLEVEYKMGESWKKLFIALKSGYNCTICKSNLLTNLHGIRNHISNRQHKSNMEIIKGIFHPKFFACKDSNLKEESKLNNLSQNIKNKEKDSEKQTKCNNDINQNISPIQITLISTNKDNQLKKIEDEKPKEKQTEQNKLQKEQKDKLKSNEESEKKQKDNKINHETQKNQEAKQKKEEDKQIIQVYAQKLQGDENKSHESKQITEEQDKKQEEKPKKMEESHKISEEIQKVTGLEIISSSKYDQTPIQFKRKIIDEFINKMSLMKKDDLLKVEYRGNDKVLRKIIVTEGFFYTCDVCNVKKLKDIPLYDHIKGKKHRDKVHMKVVTFCHPLFTEDCFNEEKDKDKIFESSKTSKDKNLISEPEILILNKDIEIVTVEDSPEREITPPGTEGNSKNIVLNPLSISRSQLIDVEQINQKNHSKTTIVATKEREDNEKIIKNTNNASFEKKEFSITINNEVEGFVGVEYVVKIIKHATDNDPRFECCLCETELNGTGMQCHLKSLTHRIKYLDRHFPTSLKQFKEYRGIPSVMFQITEKICKAIEKYHGRDLPLECVQNDYRVNRQEYIEKVFSYRHAAEISGPSFTNIIDRTELERIIENKNCKMPENTANKITFTNRDNKRKTYPFTTESDTRSQLIPRTNEKKTGRAATNHQMLPYRQPINFNPIFGCIPQNNTPSFEPVGHVYENPYNQGYYQNAMMHDTQFQPKCSEFLDNEEHRRLSENFIKSTKVTDKPGRYYKQTTHLPRRHRKSRSTSRSRSRSLRDLRSLSRSPLREDDIWQAYRRKFDIDVKLIDMDFESYYKDPQLYPLYNEEWQTFWANRMNDLKEAGRDYHNHDFTYEWSLYFPKRLEELYLKEVEALKVRLRERFVLPMHNDALLDSKYHVNNDYFERNISAVKDPCDSANDNMQDHSRNTNNRMTREAFIKSSPPYRVTKRKSVSVEKTVNENENLNSNRYQTESEPHIKKKKIVKTRSPSPNNESDDIERELENDSNAMSVLRVLTGLEDHLGASLGPKIIDLMSKALVLEKAKPNSVDENLLTIDNCILLETCREKLKGQIVAGLYKNQQLRAVKNVIRDITIISKKATKLRTNSQKQMEVQNILKRVSVGPAPKFSSAPRAPAKVLPKSTTSSNTKTSNQNSNKSNVGSTKQTSANMMSMTQKKELARKLAQALAAQGKTDISTEHCEQLIEVYTLIDKKNQENGNLNTDEKTLSECLQDCIKSGSLNSLTDLFQEKNKSSNQPSQQQKQFDDINSQVQSILMALKQDQGSQPNQNEYRNFPHLANFDTSLNLTNPLHMNRSSFKDSNIGNRIMPSSNRTMFNNTGQNWVQGSVLSNTLNVPTNNSLIDSNKSFGSSTSYMQSNFSNIDQNMNSNFINHNQQHQNWHRNDSMSQQNYYPNQFGNSTFNLQSRYNRR